MSEDLSGEFAGDVIGKVGKMLDECRRLVVGGNLVAASFSAQSAMEALRALDTCMRVRRGEPAPDLSLEERAKAGGVYTGAPRAS